MTRQKGQGLGLGSQICSPSDYPCESPCPTPPPSPSPLLPSSVTIHKHGTERRAQRRAIRTRTLSVYECVAKMDGLRTRGAFAVAGADDCWPWLWSTDPNGYPRTTVGGRLFGAHRVMVVAALGKDIPGLSVDHVCRNTRCMNPAHLEPVPMWLNLARIPGDTRAASVRSRAESGLCSRGHNDWVDHPNGSGSAWCRECARSSNRERDELVRLAAASLRITRAEYVREFGLGKERARMFIRDDRSAAA